VLLSVLSKDPDSATIEARARSVVEMSDALDLPESATVVRAWLAQRKAQAALNEINSAARGCPRP